MGKEQEKKNRSKLDAFDNNVGCVAKIKPQEFLHLPFHEKVQYWRACEFDGFHDPNTKKTNK